MIDIDKSRTVRREFAVDGPLELSVRLGHGSVLVQADDAVTTASVELTALGGDAATIAIQQSGRTLSVHAPRQGGVFELFSERRRELSVDAVIRVPAGSALRVATYTADITVAGRVAHTDVATGTARIDLEHVAGDLRLRCGTATSSVGHVDGSVTVRSGTGDVRLGAVAGRLDCQSGSGGLEVEQVHGSARVRSGNGRIQLTAAHGDVDLLSGSGAISVGVPAGVSARLDLQTGYGSARSELPLNDSPSAGLPQISVRARTGAGDIRIVRAG